MDNITGFFNEVNSNPTDFYFEVKFMGRHDMDSAFQRLSGLKLTFGTQEVREGGTNFFERELPTQPTYSNLILKRCLVFNSSLDKWCKGALEHFEFDPKNLKVSLVKNNGGSLASWIIDGAYPVSWELSSLDNASNEVAIETLELQYRHFKRER